MNVVRDYTVNNPDASNATYTPASLALGLSVEDCLKFAALCEAYLKKLDSGVEVEHGPEQDRPL